MMNMFDYSIIIAVYNTEAYLRETINSIINQTDGFSKTQIILVDDGSTDSSLSICNEYAASYPQNIFVIHKENGGVSTARNAGLSIATGTFINFLDSDDLLSPNVLSSLSDFNKAHTDQDYDVIAIRLKLFDGSSGEHILNYKFNQGNRVIDLELEPEAIQLSSSSCFIRKSIIDKLSLSFDTSLKYAEDAKFLQYILLEKKKLAVLSDAVYFYRTRTDENLSAIQKSISSPAWWLPCLKGFQKEIIEYCLKKENTLPLFIQYTLCYELSWKFKQKTFNRDAISDQEISEYRALLQYVLSHIDDRIIVTQRFISMKLKLHILRTKYNQLPMVALKTSVKNAQYFFPNSCFTYNFNSQDASISIISITSDQIIIEGSAIYFFPSHNIMKVNAYINGKLLQSAELYQGFRTSMSLDEPFEYRQFFRFTIPISQLTEDIFDLRFSTQYTFGEVDLQKLTYTKLTTVRPTKAGNYYYKSGWIVSAAKNYLHFRKASAFKAFKTELVFQSHLWRINEPGSRKAAIARALWQVAKLFKKKQIWLISDRMDRAGDNGEAFFNYLAERKPQGIKPYFVIQKQSPDYIKLKKTGSVIVQDSKYHKLIHLLADKIISASGDEYVLHPFKNLEPYYCDILRDKPYIFLQHGITKDDISGWLNRFNKNIKGFVTSAIPEYNSIIHTENYYYSEKEVWLTGFPRYDLLSDRRNKKITIAPTWRQYLFTNQKDDNNYPIPSPTFSISQFNQFYSELLSNQELITYAQQKGYSIQLLVHPNMRSCLPFMRIDDRIAILPKYTLYKDVYAESSLMLTDYSSAVFDFAYLKKPIIYTQFDASTIYSGKHLYSKGYFDYERDGFGEVEYDVESTIRRIKEYIDNNCEMKPQYKERVDKFFAYTDKNNCKRVFDKIMEMDKNN